MQDCFRMFLSNLRLVKVLPIFLNSSFRGNGYFYSTLSKSSLSFEPVKIVGDNLRVQLKSSYYDFPLVWLRDNCRCDQCFHPNSQSRIICWKTFDIGVQPEYISTNENERKVTIKWNDNHISAFNLEWLYERNFTSENREHFLSDTYKPKRITWNKDDFKPLFKRFDFASIMAEDGGLKEWLEALSVYGMALITNVPSGDDSCRKIANRVEFIRKTHYGEEFSVKAKPGTTNVAYLPSNLQMHTDLPYYEYKPGVNLLHCVTQSIGLGGDNMLSDGLYAARYMKTHDKECYRVLSQTLVDWEDYGQEGNNKFHSIFRSPVICEDSDGEIVRINHSVPQRGSHFNIPINQVGPWYKCMKKFVNFIYENAAMYKVSPGEMLCFDNRRLLHGRQEYQDTADNTRHIIGAYLDWDYIFSRIRVLNNK